MSWRTLPMSRRRWAATRREVFDRDGHRCCECGRVGRLECDHITPLWIDSEQDPYDPANCQTLCRNCHIIKSKQEQERAKTIKRNPAEANKWLALVDELAL